MLQHKTSKFVAKGSLAALGVLTLMGCAGPVESRLGSSGAPLPKGEAVALSVAPAVELDGAPAAPDPEYAALTVNARDAIAASLRQAGFTIDPNATTRIDIAFTARPAATAITLASSGEVSPATHRWAFQSCHHTIYRLSIAYARSTPAIATGRASAEDSRCHGDVAALLPRLADEAVGALGGVR